MSANNGKTIVTRSKTIESPTNDLPTIDICIPCYQESWKLNQTIESIKETCDVPYTLIVHIQKQSVVKNRLACLEKSTNPYVLWLDDDVKFTTRDWASKTLLRLMSNERLGIVGVRVIHSEFRKPRYERNTGYRIDVCGAFMMTRKIPGVYFDEKYIASQAEDTDYCYQVIQKGYKIYQDNSIEILHFAPHKNVNASNKFNNTYFFQKWGQSLNYFPKISICIPTYNRSQYLKQAIESALNQSYSNYEIVILDDGSTDNTEQVINSINNDKIKHYKNSRNSGRPYTRNKCIEYAKGEYILWLDDDDILAENTINRYIETLNNNKSIDVLYGELQLIDSFSNIIENKIIPQDFYNDSPRILFNLIKGQGGMIPFGGSIVRKSLYEKYGRYNKEFTRAQDAEFWIRIAPYANFKKVNAVTYYYRQHENNISLGKFIDLSYESLLLSKLLNSNVFCYVLDNYNWQDYEKAKYQFYSDVARRFFQFRDFFNASRILEKLNNVYNQPEDRELLIYSYLGSGELEKAEKNIISLKHENPFEGWLNGIKALRRELNNGISLKNIPKIRKDIESYIGNKQFGQDCFDAVFALGQISEKLKEKEIAYKYYSLAISRNPVNKIAYEKGIILEKELALDPKINGIRKRLLESVSVPDETVLNEYYSKNVKQNELNKSIQKAEYEIQNGNKSEAREILEKIMTQDPNNIDALNNLSILEILEGNYENAALLLKKVVDIDPTNEAATENIKYLENILAISRYLVESERCVEEKEYSKAKKLLNKILSIDAKNVDALNNLSVIHMLEGNHLEAATTIDSIIDIDPQNETAAENLKIIENVISVQAE